MSQDYELPGGVTIEVYDDGKASCSFTYRFVVEWRPTFSEALDAAEAVLKDELAERSAALRRIREIRAERGLGRLVWERSKRGVLVAEPAAGALRFEVERMVDGQWWADAASRSNASAMCMKHPTEAAAKAQCEEWFAEWLDRAGLEVRHGR